MKIPQNNIISTCLNVADWMKLNMEIIIKNKNAICYK